MNWPLLVDVIRQRRRSVLNQGIDGSGNKVNNFQFDLFQKIGMAIGTDSAYRIQ